MSDPQWRDTRPSRPYGSEPEARPPGRDTRMPADSPRNPVGGVRPPAGGVRPPADGPRPPAGGGAPRRDPGAPGRDPGEDGRYPGWVDPRGREPRLGSREPGGREPDGNRRDPGNFVPRGGDPVAPRGGDPAIGAQTRRMPPLPDATQAMPRPGDTRPGMRPQAGTQRATAPGGRGTQGARGAQNSREGWKPERPAGSRRRGRWGSLQGGIGVCLIVAGTAIGAIATMVTASAPGFLLGALVVIGTVAAALAVRPGAGRMIFPVPVLCYLVAALLTGVIYNHSADSSKTALAIGAAQWVASGFLAMATATILAVVLVTIRWYLWHRRRGAGRDSGWQVPATGGRAPQPPSGRETFADATYPSYTNPGRVSYGRDNGARNDPERPGAGTPDRGRRRPGPQPGSGPYNFSSGA